MSDKIVRLGNPDIDHYLLYDDNGDDVYQYTPEEWEEIYPQLHEDQFFVHCRGGSERGMTKKQNERLFDMLKSDSVPSKTTAELLEAQKESKSITLDGSGFEVGGIIGELPKGDFDE